MISVKWSTIFKGFKYQLTTKVSFKVCTVKVNELFNKNDMKGNCVSLVHFCFKF